MGNTRQDQGVEGAKQNESAASTTKKVAGRPLDRRAEGLLSELQRILDREEDAVVSLIRMSEEEREALARKDLPALTQCTEAKERGVTRMSQVEGERSQCVADIAKAVSLDGEAVSLTALVEHLDTPWRERLWSHRGRILKQVERLAEIDRANRVLLESSIRLVEDCVAFLTSFKRADVGYSEVGQPRTAARLGASILDARA